MIKQFYKMLESSVLEIARKLEKAQTILEHSPNPGNEKINDLLLKIIKNDFDAEYQEMYDNNEQELITSKENKILAAALLVWQGNEAGKEFLIKSEQKMGADDIEITMFYLGRSRNKLGIELYLYFADKYRFVGQQIDRDYFQQRLNIKSNKILNEYKHKGVEGNSLELEWFAKSYKDEYVNLVKLFYKIKENTYARLLIAEILVRLEPAEKLKEKLKNFCDEVIAMTDKNKSELAERNKVTASFLLIKLNEKKGEEALKEASKNKESEFWISQEIENL